MTRRWWRRAALATIAGTVTVIATSTWLDAGTGTASAAQGPLPLPVPSLPVPLPSVPLPSVSLPAVPLPSISLPPLLPSSPKPTTTGPAAPPSAGPSAGHTPGPAPAPSTAPPGARGPAAPAPAGPVTGPGAGAEIVGADPGADLYPQPPVDPAATPDARRVAALTDVEHRIQYLQNVLARTRDDLATVQRQPDPVLQLLTAWTAGTTATGDPAPPLAVVDTADLLDTPTGRAAALSAAITSGEAELAARQREEARLRQEIDRRARAARVAAAAAAPAARDAAAGARLGRPLSGRLTSRFGVRFDPYYHVWQRHPGIDLAAPVGTPIVAAADGRVTRAGWYGGYGNYTCVDHGRADGQRLSTCYGHQSRLLVSPGQRVRAGQVIGLVGSTGASTGPHLHFEVRLGGRAVDPLPWI